MSSLRHIEAAAQEEALRRPEAAAALCEELARQGARRVILLGIPSVMQEPYLKGPIIRSGIMVLTPPADQREMLAQMEHSIRAGANLAREDIERFQALVAEGAEHGADCLIVASAELAELVRQSSMRLPVVDALRAGSERVKHVVFDMGGVLLRWDPLAMARKVCAPEEDARLLVEAIFHSTEWTWQDAGAVSEETVAWTAKTRVPEHLHAAVDQLVYHWHDNRLAMPHTGELIYELKEDGRDVFLLSNAGPAFEQYKYRLPAYDCFDGIVVSCFEHVVKPDARIYGILCERYGLEAADCLFVDDMERNIHGARRVGMQGWRYDGTAEGLRYHLLGARP